MAQDEPKKGEGTSTPRERSRARVRAVGQAGAPLLRGKRIHAQATSRGAVRIEKITEHEDENASWVEVYLSGETEGGDPHFRIFNPPTLVRDPNGDIYRAELRYREDPIAAIAEVIASLGGASTDGRKGRRR